MKKSHPLTDLDADIRDHIDRETQDNIDRGMTREEARYAALRKFGNVALAKENARAVWEVDVARTVGARPTLHPSPTPSQSGIYRRVDLGLVIGTRRDNRDVLDREQRPAHASGIR
jgi:hypothetical protein